MSARGPDKRFVLVGLFSAKPEVHVGHLHPEARMNEQVQQDHGVDAPADCYKDRMIFSAQVVLSDKVGKLRLHGTKLFVIRYSLFEAKLRVFLRRDRKISFDQFSRKAF